MPSARGGAGPLGAPRLDAGAVLPPQSQLQSSPRALIRGEEGLKTAEPA